MTMKCRQELFCVSSVLTGSIPERLNGLYRVPPARHTVLQNPFPAGHFKVY